MFSLFENSQNCSNEFKEGIKEDLKILSSEIHFTESGININQGVDLPNSVRRAL
jgi:hypothetical protein